MFIRKYLFSWRHLEINSFLLLRLHALSALIMCRDDWLAYLVVFLVVFEFQQAAGKSFLQQAPTTFRDDATFAWLKNYTLFLHCLGSIDMLSANQNAEIFVCILLTLKPMYTPVVDGYQLRTFHTTHDGITFRFPLPKRPYSFNMNRLYAAFLNFCALLSKRS